MKQYASERQTTEQEWPACDPRMECLVRLRALCENRHLSRPERDDAFGAAGRLAPTLEEWREARAIEEQRWALSRERKLAAGKKPPEPLWPVSERFGGEVYGPPRPMKGDAVVSQERASRLLGAIFAIVTDGRPAPQCSPPPPSYGVRTHPWQADAYWYAVALERTRRAWMTKQCLTYWPRLAIHRADLDQERPR